MAKKKKSSAFAVVQQIGKSFFLPVSVLPIAGILLGLGSSFTNADTIAAYHLQGIMGEGTILNALLTIMSQVGNTIFGNLPLIFALAVALGMAKNEKAVAVLSAGISFFVMNSTINAMLKLSGKILADGTYAKSVLNGQITSVCGIDSLQMGVFAGVIVGLVTAALHNRFYKQQLPAALAFFSGVRFVPIISVIAHIGVGIICFFVWPTIQSGIFALGNLVMHSGYFGTAIFGFLERALIPFGLHHVFYLPFWQTSLGGTMEVAGKMVEGAQNIFFAQLADPNTKHFAVEACRFMTGKYSFMMAGLPGAAYAMYRCAKPEKRKITSAVLERQKDYFTGNSTLKPMTLADIASDISMHTSTISRGIKNKYLQYPFGVVYLKDLFTSSAGKKDNNSPITVKKQLKAIIASENPNKPYSDSTLSNLLKQKGIKISRRTVAKYREEIGIKSTYNRKIYNE